MSKRKPPAPRTTPISAGKPPKTSQPRKPASSRKPTSKATKPIPHPFPPPPSPLPVAIPPTRAHSPSYHSPLLLTSPATSAALLAWFASISEKRNMPWRKEWLDPRAFEGKGGEKESEFRRLRDRRAYEVWVSEVMLQQTRVTTVIPYFNAWIAAWPTAPDLAAASHDDVLAAWKGLGYYSRATRLWEGAKSLVAKVPPPSASDAETSGDNDDAASAQNGLIPADVDSLQQIPGIGRYTAGAVSSIAFGEAAAVLDGNVARVLSRQMGLYVDVKEKKNADMLWTVAEELVASVAGDGGKSAVPGLWNQALMELGSTICTPKPKCSACPIRATCRAFAEGEALAASKVPPPPAQIPDIEDACSLCLPLDTEDLALAPELGSESDLESDADEEGKKPSKRRKVEVKAKAKAKPAPKPQNTISNYFSTRSRTTTSTATSTTTPAPKSPSPPPTEEEPISQEPAIAKSTAPYCALFPFRPPKKAAPEEHAVVCVLSSSASQPVKYLIEQRPAKGLLASLWQFPQASLPTSHDAASRKEAALEMAAALAPGANPGAVEYVADLGSLLHVFTHLRLHMHVVLLRVEGDVDADADGDKVPARKWVASGDMDGETLSTGMRRCWGLVKT